MHFIPSLLVWSCVAVLAAAETFTPPETWDGSKPGATDGNPALVAGKPAWRLDQILPADPENADNYKTLRWDQGLHQWFNEPGSQGGQPSVKAENGGIMFSVRARGGGNVDYVKGAALVFIVPADGRYEVSSDVDVWRWEGGTTTQLKVIRRFKKGAAWSALPLGGMELKPEAGNKFLKKDLALRAGDELAVIPWHDGYWSGANVTFKGFTITQTATGAAALKSTIPGYVTLPAPTGDTGGRWLPALSGVVNVKTAYGAKGDGVTDDTAALQKAITENRNHGGKVIYLPAGTYLVSDALTYGDNLEQAKFTTVQGQGRDKTVIKLKDALPEYGAGKRKAVLSLFDGNTTGMAFNNCVYDLTIDIGKGNPGAVALMWMNNNCGSCERVTLRSSDPQMVGDTGFDLSRHEPGPGMVRDLVVEGFDFGVKSVQTCFSMTFENITLRKQRVAGFSNNTQTVFIRKLNSDNKVPAIVFADQTEYGAVVLTDSILTGSGPLAIDARRPQIFLRNVKSVGYAKLIDGFDGLEIKGDWAPKFGTLSAFDGAKPQGLNLPIEETPDVAWPAPNQWAVANPERLAADYDDAPAIQETIDWAAKNGKTAVLIPGSVRFGSTITVPASIRRITGLDALSQITPDLAKSSDAVWKIVDGSEPLLIERFFVHDFGNQHAVKNCYWVSHGSKRPLIIARGGWPARPYLGLVGSKGAKLWVDDTCMANWVFTGQQVWMRQYNPESDSVMTTNDGGNLWVFGTKTECATGTWFLTKGKGKTEIIGGYTYPSWRHENTPAAPPLFIVEEGSSFSATYREQSFQGYQEYPIQMRQTKGGVTKDLKRDAFAVERFAPLVVATP